jgi:hypothetical protein
MSAGPNQPVQWLVEKGKYGPDEKLGFLNRYWSTGQSGLPEDDKLDFAKRDNIVKWERDALAGGRRGFQERLRRLTKQASPLAALSRDGGLVDKLPVLLTKEVQRGALTKFAGLEGIPLPAAKEALELFTAGMLEGLGYTSDTGEVPSAQAVARIAGPFPISCLEGASSAVCLFTCAQYGRQDVIHMYKAGIADVTLVDLSADIMPLMKRIYRPEWTYRVDDFRAFLSSTIAAKIKYDVVTADPDTPLIDEVTGARLGELAAITRKAICAPYTADLLERDGYNAGGLEQMSQSISARFGRKLKAVEVLHRNAKVYWAVIRVA